MEEFSINFKKFFGDNKSVWEKFLIRGGFKYWVLIVDRLFCKRVFRKDWVFRVVLIDI